MVSGFALYQSWLSLSPPKQQDVVFRCFSPPRSSIFHSPKSILFLGITLGKLGWEDFLVFLSPFPPNSCLGVLCMDRPQEEEAVAVLRARTRLQGVRKVHPPLLFVN